MLKKQFLNLAAGGAALVVAGCTSMDSRQQQELTGRPLSPACQAILDEARALRADGVQSLTGWSVGDIETLEDAKNWLEGAENSGWPRDRIAEVEALNDRLYIIRPGGSLIGIGDLFRDDEDKSRNSYRCDGPSY